MPHARTTGCSHMQLPGQWSVVFWSLGSVPARLWGSSSKGYACNPGCRGSLQHHGSLHGVSKCALHRICSSRGGCAIAQKFQRCNYLDFSVNAGILFGIIGLAEEGVLSWEVFKECLEVSARDTEMSGKLLIIEEGKWSKPVLLDTLVGADSVESYAFGSGSWFRIRI
eukprot:scaffold173606_cov28-Attheya_sp.AAC.1